MTTARLLLRPMQSSDLEDFHILRTEIEVMKWTRVGKIDADKEATQSWMDRYMPPNDNTTFNFAIEELSNPGSVIGVVGLHTYEPPECGYMFRPNAWGKGYATEALNRWVQAWWELPRKEVVMENPEQPGNAQEMELVPEVLIADMDQKNVASARVVTKCGFRYVSEEDIEQNGTIVKLIVFELPRPE